VIVITTPAGQIGSQVLRNLPIRVTPWGVPGPGLACVVRAQGRAGRLAEIPRVRQPGRLPRRVVSPILATVITPGVSRRRCAAWSARCCGPGGWAFAVRAPGP
jgi:hypothetical protein